MNTSYERLRADMARRDTEMVKRDKSNMQWIAGFVLGSAVLGLLLTSTPAP